MKKNFLKSCLILSTLALCSAVEGDTLIGIMGGDADNFVPAAYQVYASATFQNIPGLPVSGAINEVAINGSGLGVIGGQDQTVSPLGPIAYLVPPTGSIIPLNPQPLGYISSAAINSSGNGIVGGQIEGSFAIASTFNSSGQANPIDLSGVSSNAYIATVAINNSGQAFIGGSGFDVGVVPIAFCISSEGTLSSGVTGLAVTGQAVTVAINDQGLGIIGGDDNTMDLAYAAFVQSSNSPAAIPLTLTGTLSGKIGSVAINSSGNAVIGGYYANSMYTDYYPAAYLTNTDNLSPSLITGLPAYGYINGVAINAMNVAILGGQSITDTMVYTGPAVAYLVSPTGAVTQLDLSTAPANSEIITVAINGFGAGILGGLDITSIAPIAYLYSQDGTVTQLTGFPSGMGYIDSVAVIISSVMPLLSQIPTAGLHGNNLHFANYINKYDPSAAFYFVPSVLNGTLVQALESAAPTRNAFSLFTADNNLFFLNSSLSKHSHNSRLIRRQTSQTEEIAFAEIEHPLGMDPELLLASNGNHLAWSKHKLTPYSEKKSKQVEECTEECAVETDWPYQIWGDVLGALAYQKKQHQTPAFDPTAGAAILAFDAKVSTHAYFGGGAAYAYSHIHEDKNAGHANINQEYLFIYGLWDNTKLYFDAALWGGLFQTENVRKIRMTGFEFQSKSHPKGWQLEPHFEVGYDVTSCTQRTTFEPFVMLDWISNWQRSYQETGSGPFNAGQKKHYSSFLRSEAGGRFYQAMRYCTWNLVFQEKLSYVNKKPFKVGTVHAFLVGAPGSFTVETLTTPQNLCVAELQMIFEPNDPGYPSGSIDYQLEYGSMYQSHVVSLNMNWNF